MQCKSCRATVPDGSAFCNRCGANVSTGGGRDTPPVTAGPPAAAPAAPPAPAGAKPEQHVWSGRYSLKAMGGWMLLLALLGIFFLYIYVFKLRLGEYYNTRYPTVFGWLFSVVFLVLAIWLLVVGLKRKLGARYRLSTQRLFVENGLFSRDIDEVELVRVDDVSVSQNIVQRIFNVGEVKVMAPTDADNPTTLLVGIPNPIEVKEMIRNQTQELRKKSVRMEAI